MVLLDLPFQRIKGRFFPEPLPPPGTFEAQTVLITGGTAGLGLAAALHFARLGADVIITCRAKSRGCAAKEKIQKAAPEAQVVVMELDMARYDSCVAFVAELKSSRAGQGGIDVAVLNAGILTPRFVRSPEGWWVFRVLCRALKLVSLTVQLDTGQGIDHPSQYIEYYTAGHAALGHDKSRARQPNLPARIVFVTSRDHLYADISHWKEWSEKEGILHRLSDEKYWPAPWKLEEPNYANSKLLVMYAIEEISKRAVGSDGEPQVIVNSVCPGMVKTDIGRNVADQAWFMKALVWVYLSITAKPPDYGARHYVKAALCPKEEHGQFCIAWLSHEQYLKKAKVNVTSENARKVQALAWKEILGELGVKVPGLERHWIESL